MKKRLSSSNTIVAIDIGTTKICVLVAHKMEDSCEVIGIGRAPSEGLARGVVVDIGPAIKSIRAAVEEAELMSGCSIESAYIGISGSHIRAHQSSGMIPIKNGIIRAPDIERVLAAARAVPLPEDEQVLHALAQQFVIDGKHAVRDPLQMHGVRLEATVHLVTGNVTQVKNLIRCCEAAGVKVRDVVLEPIASAEAVLSADERELGTGMLDIGGGTSDFAIYQRGVIRHTSIFPIAGNMFTNDLALCLRTTRDEAERLKRAHGSVALCDEVFGNAPCVAQNIEGFGEHGIDTRDMVLVLQARATELMRAMQVTIEMQRLQPLMPAGLVLTGGGAQLRGLSALAAETLRVPVRVGTTRVSSLFASELGNPMYATGYGLLLYGLRQESDAKKSQEATNFAGRIFWKMKSWVGDFF